MKKTVSLTLLLLLALSLFASAEKYYPVSSSEWKQVDALCRYAGVAGPTSAGPVTEKQLELALDRAARRLGEDNPLVVAARSSLGMENTLVADGLGSLSYLGEIAPEIYLQTSGSSMESDVYDPDRDWPLASSVSRSPFLRFTLEADLKDQLYARLALPLDQKTLPLPTSASYWDDAFHTNVYGASLAQNIPYDAGLSLGTGSMNLMVARGHLSLGEGFTGNTAIGDNYDYQEFVKASFWTEHFGVYLSLTNFDSSHYLSTSSKPMYEVAVSNFSGYKQLRHSVTYEALPLDSLRFSLSFINLLDTTSALDFRYFNPFMIMHNMFNYHEDTILEANNMIFLDLSWNVAEKWKVYGQLCMDQIQLSSEVTDYAAQVGYVDPNAFGGLLNVSYTDVVEEGVLTLYGEGVMTMPGLYLNEKYYDAEGNLTQKRSDANTPCWSQDWLVGYNRTEEGTDDVAFSGYLYGPDCVALAFGGSYEKEGLYSLSGEALYVAHGEKGTGTEKSNYNFSGIDSGNTMWKLPLVDEIVEHRVVLTMEGEYWFKPWLSLCGGVAYSHYENYHNIMGKSFDNLQLALGLHVTTR